MCLESPYATGEDNREKREERGKERERTRKGQGKKRKGKIF
tara:strand:+ start:356 stop:478 length:123 start_codon:yes stop_codon:yes gene_type:complete